ncbi:hypothetical protein [Mesorhizobium sp. M0030]|uniref:hypothetical protein n=1 Tax=Mesorhizobium sp. M0030 TaxID=2956851 RepID=UPI0033350B18
MPNFAKDDITASSNQNGSKSNTAQSSQKPNGKVREYTASEKIAIEALNRHDKNIDHIEPYDEIENFGNSTLVLAEVFWPPAVGKKDFDGPYEYQVVVRNGRGSVYSDFSQTVREGSKQAEIISRLASPDVVTAILTFILVLAYICLVGLKLATPEASQALGTALSTVLGFWFGRQTKSV